MKAGARQGMIEERGIVMEILQSIKRAGADLIITYFAKEAAKILQETEDRSQKPEGHVETLENVEVPIKNLLCFSFNVRSLDVGCVNLFIEYPASSN